MEGRKLARTLRDWRDGNPAQRREALTAGLGIPVDVLDADPDYYAESIEKCARHALEGIEACTDAPSRRRAEARLARCYENCALMRDARARSMA